MNRMQTSRSCEIRYHLMADALYWVDEIPDNLDTFSENCLRIILRYRTSLIQGKPDEKWKIYWEEAVRSFPEWIGFRQDRCNPNPELLHRYENYRQQAYRDLGLDDIDDESGKS